jgi:hypothetical protein
MHLARSGAEYYTWEKPVPRIPNEIADCAVYLYHSRNSALSGARAGGSGFLVRVPSDAPGYNDFYAVTNDHMVADGCQVLRLNTKQGKVEAIQTKYEDWEQHPEGDDIAVCPIKLTDDFKYSSVGIEGVHR